MPVAILAERLDLGLDLVDGAVEIGQPVAAGIVPDRRDQMAGGEQRIGRGGAAAPVGQGVFVLRQPPSGIKGLPEQAGPVPCQDGLVAHLRTDGIDRMGVREHRPGRNLGVAQHLGAPQVGGAQMAGPQALARFRVAAQHDPAAGMFGPGGGQHSQKPAAPRAHQRCVAARLVDHQDIARLGRRKIGTMAVVFRQVQGAQPRDAPLRAILKPCGRPVADQPFDHRGPGRVEMQAPGVDQQADRAAPGDPAPGPARQHRPQKGILDRDDGGAGAGGDGPPAPGRGACPPDADPAPRPGQARAKLVSGKAEDAADAGRAPEPEAVGMQPPGVAGDAGIVGHGPVSARRWPTPYWPN